MVCQSAVRKTENGKYIHIKIFQIKSNNFINHMINCFPTELEYKINLSLRVTLSCQMYSAESWSVEIPLWCKQSRNTGFEPDRLYHHVHDVHVYTVMMNVQQCDACNLSSHLQMESVNVVFPLTFVHKIIYHLVISSLIAVMSKNVFPLISHLCRRKLDEKKVNPKMSKLFFCNQRLNL